MFKIIAGILLVCCTNIYMFSQENNDSRISNLPYYSYGKGLGLTSPDSIFQLNIRFRIQNRVAYLQNVDDTKAFEGQVRRLRLRFDGFVGNPSFVYAIQLSFAPGDVGTIEEGQNINIIRDAVVYYILDQKWNFGFGQTKLPGNRQRVNSSGGLQLTDRSINNANFNVDRDFGFFINFLNQKPNQFSYNVRSSITTGDGRNYTKSPDEGLAYTSKLEILPLGRFSNDGIYFEGDLFREKMPKVMLSLAYHYNHKAKRQSGVLGDELFAPRNIQSVLADFLFKYQGWAVMSTYMNRNTNNPFTFNNAGNSSIVFVGEGVDFQSSYTFISKYEIIGRYSFLRPYHSISSLFPDQKQITLGLSKYIWEHSFKLQLEASRQLFEYQDLSTANSYYLRFQIEMGI